MLDPLHWAGRMSEQTYSLWERFEREEPFGPRQLNLMLAMLCALSERGTGKTADYLPGR